MKYLGTILGFCLVVFGAFAVYKFTPDAFTGAHTLATGIYNFVSSVGR